MPVLAEIIASAMSLLVTFNQANRGRNPNNPEGEGNPKALAQLDGYTRPLVGSISAIFSGLDRVSKVESLQEIIADIGGYRRQAKKTIPESSLSKVHRDD